MSNIKFKFRRCRNISSPENDCEKIKVYAGQASIASIAGLPDEANVRKYLHGETSKKKKLSPVHAQMRDTLINSPELFGILNGGVTIVARSVVVNSNETEMILKGASVINGSQTKGVIEDCLKSECFSDCDDSELPSVKFEIIVTDNEELISDVSISRNIQSAVQPLSIVGHRKQLDKLDDVMRMAYPGKCLRKRESDPADSEHIDTQKLLQATFALLPTSIELPEMSPKLDLSSKVFSYNQKAKCLQAFSQLAESGDSEGYSAFLDTAPIAWRLYEKWKVSSNLFDGRKIKSINGKDGVKKPVPDGVIFPILAAQAALMAQRSDGKWVFSSVGGLSDADFAREATDAYQRSAESNPQTMGKSHHCYYVIQKYVEGVLEGVRRGAEAA